MRVIGGTLRGRRLETRVGRGTRPTSGRVRGAIFNIISQSVDEARVLDLFAGSGALGIEALSRGAASAVLVESMPAAARTIKNNVRTLGLESKVELLSCNVDRALGLLAGAGESFQLAFVDPPYGKGTAEKVLAELARTGLIAENGAVVVEHGKRDVLKSTYVFLKLRCTRRYGDTCVSIYNADCSADSRGEVQSQRGGQE